MGNENYQMFKCPVCKRLHPVNRQAEDLDEVTCPDNETSELRLIRGRENPDRFTQNNWNFNRGDTKIKDYTNDLELKGLQFNRARPSQQTMNNWK